MLASQHVSVQQTGVQVRLAVQQTLQGWQVKHGAQRCRGGQAAVRVRETLEVMPPVSTPLLVQPGPATLHTTVQSQQTLSVGCAACFRSCP